MIFTRVYHTVLYCVVEFELYKLRALRRFPIYMVLHPSHYSGSNFVDAT